ncbi:hypothetical protein RFI_38243, partial [Reticulomyxa filosa]
RGGCIMVVLYDNDNLRILWSRSSDIGIQSNKKRHHKLVCCDNRKKNINKKKKKKIKNIKVLLLIITLLSKKKKNAEKARKKKLWLDATVLASVWRETVTSARGKAMHLMNICFGFTTAMAWKDASVGLILHLYDKGTYRL